MGCGLFWGLTPVATHAHADAPNHPQPFKKNHTNRVVRQTPPSRSDSRSVERGTGNHHMAPHLTHLSSRVKVVVRSFPGRVAGWRLILHPASRVSGRRPRPPRRAPCASCSSRQSPAARLTTLPADVMRTTSLDVAASVPFCFLGLSLLGNLHTLIHTHLGITACRVRYFPHLVWVVRTLVSLRPDRPLPAGAQGNRYTWVS